MSEMKINKQNFEKEVLQSNLPVLVDFWADWCGPCRMLGPVIHDIAEEFDGRIKVGKVNVDEEMELAQKFQIDSIPTVILFKDGKPVRTSVGFRSKEDMKRILF